METSFLEIKSVDDLAAYFGYTRQQLDYILYAMLDEKKYKVFHIKKRNGSTRVIHSPNGPIRKLQKRLKATLDEIYQPKSCVHGYITNRGIKSNATKHTRKKWVARIDLKDFFPSIHYGRVFGMFKSKPFNFTPDIAKRLAAMCCHDKFVPQGAITSPVISNIICSRLDLEIMKLCINQKIYYTRYADDLILSTNREEFPSDFLSNIDGKIIAGATLESVIKGNGFEINTDKNSLISSKSRQMVTGVVVNRKLNVTKTYTRQLKGILHAWEIYGKESVEKRFFEKYDKRNRIQDEHHVLSFDHIVRGKILHIASIKGFRDKVFIKMAKRFEKLSDGFELKKIRSYSAAQLSVRLLTEGKTDLIHIESAQSHFKNNGFESLLIDFESSLPIGADSKLKTKLDQLKGIEQKHLTICLFDRDIENTIKEEVTSTIGYKKWAKGLYSAIIPLPETFPCSENQISIESYYPEETLFAYDGEGRRLYARSEFNDDCTHKKSNFIRFKHPKLPASKYLLDCDVVGNVIIDTSDVKSPNIALSKTNFALHIKNKAAGFEEVDFKNFRPLFSLLSAIQNDFFT